MMPSPHSIVQKCRFYNGGMIQGISSSEKRREGKANQFSCLKGGSGGWQHTGNGAFREKKRKPFVPMGLGSDSERRRKNQTRSPKWGKTHPKLIRHRQEKHFKGERVVQCMILNRAKTWIRKGSPGLDKSREAKTIT